MLGVELEELELVELVELDDELPHAATTTATTTVRAAVNVRLLFTIAPSSPLFVLSWTIAAPWCPRAAQTTLSNAARDVHPG
jgi:hypothetical protein